MTYPSGNLGYPGHTNRPDEWEALLDAVFAPPRVQMRQTAGQTIATSSFVALTWDIEDVDNWQGHSTTVNPSRYTCRLAGWYELSGKVAWVANNTGQRASQWAVNGTGLSGSQASISSTTAGEREYVTVTMEALLAVGDYVELWAFQDTGSGLATSVANSPIQSIMHARWTGTA